MEADDTSTAGFDPTERYCARCQDVRPPNANNRCEKCGESTVLLFDADGALSRAFLHARGFCCDSGCRNCPWNDKRTHG